LILGIHQENTIILAEIGAFKPDLHWFGPGRFNRGSGFPYDSGMAARKNWESSNWVIGTLPWVAGAIGVIELSGDEWGREAVIQASSHGK